MRKILKRIFSVTISVVLSVVMVCPQALAAQGAVAVKCKDFPDWLNTAPSTTSGGVPFLWCGNSTSDITIDMTFSTDEDSWFEVDFIGAIYALSNSVNNGYLSKASYKLNNEAVTDLTTYGSNPTLEVINKDLTAGYGYATEQWASYKFIEPIYLEAGDHTMTLYLKTASGGTVNAFLDKFVFTPCEAPEPSYDIEVKGADVAGANGLTTNADGVLVLNKIAGEEYVIEIPFTAPISESYEVSFIMAADADIARASSQTAPIWYSFDSNEEKRIKNFADIENPEVTATITATSLGYSENSSEWAEYKLNSWVTLAQGEHILKLFLDTPGSGNEGNIYFLLDKIIMKPADKSATSIEVKPSAMQIKNVSALADKATATGGKRLQIYTNDTSKFPCEVVLPFTVGEAGEYYIWFEICASIQNKDSAKYVAEVEYMLNDSEYAELKADKSNAFLKTVTADLVETHGMSINQWGYYRSAKPVTLREGNNNIGLRIVGPGALQSGDNVVFFLDKLNVQKVQTITDASIEVTSGTMQIGDSQTIKLYDQNDMPFYIEDVNTVAFQSSNDYIAKADGNGEILAVNSGMADVMACVKLKNGETVNPALRVYVIGDSGLYVKSSAASGNNVAVTVKADKEYTGAAKIYVGNYGYENGVITSLKSVRNAEIGNMTAGQEKGFNVTLDAVEASDTIYVFIWDNMIPLFGKTKVN